MLSFLRAVRQSKIWGDLSKRKNCEMGRNRFRGTKREGRKVGKEREKEVC